MFIGGCFPNRPYPFLIPYLTVGVIFFFFKRETTQGYNDINYVYESVLHTNAFCILGYEFETGTYTPSHEANTGYTVLLAGDPPEIRQSDQFKFYRLRRCSRSGQTLTRAAKSVNTEKTLAAGRRPGDCRTLCQPTQLHLPPCR